MIKSVENIIRKAGKEINDEPGFEIVDSDDSGITNNLASWANIGCMKVQNNVNEKDHINDGVDHQQTYIFRGFVF